MRTDELIVLKLGGSVLKDRDALAQAVHEVYRWWRRGHKIVAVVSALEGETDRLLAEARSLTDEPASDHCATLLATGELRAAALLGLALQRAGLCASVLTPHQVALRVSGSGLDAEPVSIDAARVQGELEPHGIVVIPGFIGIGEQGDLRTLGRGGSDLSALFIAHALGAAACRLVKDVPGLFDRDPKLPGPPASRFSHITFADALRLDGGIVQHKAVRFARDRGLRFEVAGLHSSSCTLVGQEGSIVADRADPRPPLRVAVLGLGTVGLGVYRRLAALPELFTMTAAVCRNTSRAASQGVDPSILRAGLGHRPDGGRSNPHTLLDHCDVLIEAIGGIEPAGSVVEAALARGIHVVTANKALVAVRHGSLRAAAERGGAQFLFSAAVGGAAPIVEGVRSLAATTGITRIDGVLNGTINFVLDALARGQTFDAAIAEAQRRGLAEADPSRDLSGRDAADKLAVLCSIITDGAASLDAASIPREELTPAAVERLAEACARGAVVRQVTTLDLSGPTPRGRVTLSSLPIDHPLAAATGSQSAALLTDRRGGSTLVRAQGAGRWPTTESVMADCLALARAVSQPGPVSGAASPPAKGFRSAHALSPRPVS